jgi:hypothetical protein
LAPRSAPEQPQREKRRRKDYPPSRNGLQINGDGAVLWILWVRVFAGAGVLVGVDQVLERSEKHVHKSRFGTWAGGGRSSRACWHEKI